MQTTNPTPAQPTAAKFLADKTTNEVLQLHKVKKLSNGIEAATKARFTNSVELAVLVARGADYFNSKECKTLLQSLQLDWNVSDFVFNVYGFQTSYFYKLVKVGNLPGATVTQFIAECDKAELEGNDVMRSITGLLNYVRSLENSEQGGTGPSITKVKPQFELNFRPVGQPDVVKLVVDSTGHVKTSAQANDIKQAIEYLNTLLVKIEQDQTAAAAKQAELDAISAEQAAAAARQLAYAKEQDAKDKEAKKLAKEAANMKISNDPTFVPKVSSSTQPKKSTKIVPTAAESAKAAALVADNFNF